MPVGTLIYFTNLVTIDSITKASLLEMLRISMLLLGGGKGGGRGGGGRGGGVGFINFIFRPKCYFLAARKGVVRGTVRRGERRQKRGKGEWLASGNAV